MKKIKPNGVYAIELRECSMATIYVIDYKDRLEVRGSLLSPSYEDGIKNHILMVGPIKKLKPKKPKKRKMAPRVLISEPKLRKNLKT